jgi:hypothetical protein
MSNKISWRRVLAFLYFAKGATTSTGQVVTGWLTTHTEETKFNHAMNRVAESCMKRNAEMQQVIEDLEIDNQATGDHGILLYNPDGSRAYTAVGIKVLRDAKLALMDSEVEIEPHFVTEIPEGLDDGARELLKGFVIRETELQAVKVGT